MFLPMSHFATPAVRRIGTLTGLAALAAALLPAAAAAGRLPKGFAYLRDVAPGIAQDMRYAGTDNFTGQPLPGYDAAECVLRRDVAAGARPRRGRSGARKSWAEGLRLLPPGPRGRSFCALGARIRKSGRRRRDQALLSDAGEAPPVRRRLYRQPFGAFDRQRGRSHAGATTRRARAGLRSARILRPLHGACRRTRARQFHRHGHRLRLLRRQEPHFKRRGHGRAAALARQARRRHAQARLPQLFPRMVALQLRHARAGLRRADRAAS